MSGIVVRSEKAGGLQLPSGTAGSGKRRRRSGSPSQMENGGAVDSPRSSGLPLAMGCAGAVASSGKEVSAQA